MGSGQNNNGGLHFNSADISKKVGPNYFSGKPKANHLTKIIDYISTHKTKIIIVAGATMVAIAVVVLWVAVWSKPSTSDNSSSAEISWSDQLVNIRDEAAAILGANSGDGFLDALSFLDDKIANETLPERIIDLKLTRLDFLSNNGGVNSSLGELLTFDESTLSKDQLLHLWSSIRYAYYELGNEELALVYQGKITQLMLEGEANE